MNITMSADAQEDGAWGTILNRLKGFTFEVTRTNEHYFVGRILEADELEVTFELERPTRELTIAIDSISEMEYV